MMNQTRELVMRIWKGNDADVGVRVYDNGKGSIQVSFWGEKIDRCALGFISNIFFNSVTGSVDGIKLFSDEHSSRLNPKDMAHLGELMVDLVPRRFNGGEMCVFDEIVEYIRHKVESICDVKLPNDYEAIIKKREEGEDDMQK